MSRRDMSDMSVVELFMYSICDPGSPTTSEQVLLGVFLEALSSVGLEKAGNGEARGRVDLPATISEDTCDHLVFGSKSSPLPKGQVEGRSFEPFALISCASRACLGRR